MLNCSALARAAASARLRGGACLRGPDSKGELAGLNVTKCPHLDGDSRNVLCATKKSVPFLFSTCRGVIGSTLFRNYSISLRLSHHCNPMQRPFEIQHWTGIIYCVRIAHPEENVQDLLTEDALFGQHVGLAAISQWYLNPLSIING